MNKRNKSTIDSLIDAKVFSDFLISILTMKVFYPDDWYKSYDVKLLLDEIDYHIKELNKTSNCVATPIGIGAIDIVYHDHSDGKQWPTYNEILCCLKNDIIARWDGVPVKRKTLNDIEKEQEEAELQWEKERNNKD